MKRVCFLKFEGILENKDGYVVDKKNVKIFLSALKSYCEKNNIKLVLVSGFYKDVAKKKFNSSVVKEFFSNKNFFCVDDE